MVFDKIKSYAKINLALNITGKTSSIHKIESLIMFASLYDKIFIKKIKSKKHNIKFFGKFSGRIGKKNTISELLKILEKKKFLTNQKFMIYIDKKIPSKAGLGGGSMDAANILKYFINKKLIKINKKETSKICKLIGSDVVLGLNSTNSILTSKNKISYFQNVKKFNVLIVKPNFGCATKEIYSKVKKFYKPKFNKPSKKMLRVNFLKKMTNQLEPIAFSKYPKLRLIKSFLTNVNKPLFVRMTGSGSALVAYYQSKEKCENAKKKFEKKYKNYWCIASKTI
ncbi:MAG: 4-(cytidine 5'-diphospho)-2-C-methyl-D-erythritol kinase [Candidatus Pelagibacter sp.]